MRACPISVQLGSCLFLFSVLPASSLFLRERMAPELLIQLQHTAVSNLNTPFFFRFYPPCFSMILLAGTLRGRSCCGSSPCPARCGRSWPGQGLPLAHCSAQRKRVPWDRVCIHGLFRGCWGVLGGVQGVFCYRNGSGQSKRFLQDSGCIYRLFRGCQGVLWGVRV